MDQNEIMRMPFKYAYFRGRPKSLKQLHECKTTEGFAKGYVIQELAKLYTHRWLHTARRKSRQ